MTPVSARRWVTLGLPFVLESAQPSIDGHADGRRCTLSIDSTVSSDLSRESSVAAVLTAQWPCQVAVCAGYSCNLFGYGGDAVYRLSPVHPHCASAAVQAIEGLTMLNGMSSNLHL